MKKYAFTFFLLLLNFSIISTEASYFHFNDENNEFPVQQKKLPLGLQFPLKQYKNYLYSTFSTDPHFGVTPDQRKYDSLLSRTGPHLEEYRTSKCSLMFFNVANLEDIKKIHAEPNQYFLFETCLIEKDVIFIKSATLENPPSEKTEGYKKGNIYLNFIDFNSGERKASPVLIGNDHYTINSSLKLVGHHLIVEIFKTAGEGRDKYYDYTPLYPTLLSFDVSKILPFDGAL